MQNYLDSRQSATSAMPKLKWAPYMANGCF